MTVKSYSILLTFHECGLTNSTERVAVVSENPNPHSSDFSIEGSSFSLPGQNRLPFQLNTVRVIAGGK